MKYRSKSVEVEAIEVVNVLATLNGAPSLPDWAWQGIKTAHLVLSQNELYVSTKKDGTRVAYRGDWLIRHVDGDMSVCNAADFAAKYEAV